MRRDLPTGTVTFVFTDIEGSTRLLEELGAQAYGELLGRHHAVCRRAWAAHGGVEVDTAGDAFFVAFASPPAALAASRDAQGALVELGLSVRMGVHTGEVWANETGYVGFEVHRAARIAAAAHGGQVVVSGATAAAVGQDGLVELGEHRFKDVDEPVAIFQLGDSRFPPLRTLSNTNLPRPASSFVGRERELAGVLARFEDGARLVTLTGPGGSGKTRLAIEAATTLVPHFKAGVFWVGLATLRDPALVLETVGQALGAKGEPAEHVGERELLLLLDNLEQVVEAAPELSRLMRACANLRLLVTSREVLRVEGEVEYPVPPLAEPEAVSLFCERAQTEPSGEICELCARLDNLPLAVELAAARTKALSPRQILERLAQRLDLLKGGRDADPRQQTLRATIEWSYQLLSPDERELFARLSVFSGGCTLEAAEEIADAGLDTLQSLVEKSLVRFSEGRYWMLETIKDFASGAPSRSEAKSLKNAHLHFFAGRLFAAKRAARLHEPEAMAMHRVEQANVFEALGWAAKTQATELAQRIVEGAWFYWLTSGLIATGDSWVSRIASLPSNRTLSYGQFLSTAAEFPRFLGEPERAASLKRQALSVLGELDDPLAVSPLAATLADLADILSLLGNYDDAAKCAERAVGMRREQGVPGGVAHALHAHALVAMRRRVLEDAEPLLEEAVALLDSVGMTFDGGYALFDLGRVRLARGNRLGATEALAEAFERANGDFALGLRGLSRAGLALVAVEEEPSASATEELARSLAEMHDSGNVHEADFMAEIEIGLARCRAVLGDEAYESAWNAGHAAAAVERPMTSAPAAS